MYGPQTLQQLNGSTGKEFPFIGCPIVEKSDGLYYLTPTGPVQFKKTVPAVN